MVKENKMQEKYQDIFMKISEKARKKGGSMAAVFKLIQELLEFEDKINECMNAQEMSQNKQRIELFLADIDKMYDSLFEMARGGISDIRNQRTQGGLDEPEQEDDLENEGSGGNGGAEENSEFEIEVSSEQPDKRKTPIMMNVPQIPKM